MPDQDNQNCCIRRILFWGCILIVYELLPYWSCELSLPSPIIEYCGDILMPPGLLDFYFIDVRQTDFRPGEISRPISFIMSSNHLLGNMGYFGCIIPELFR